MALAHARVLDCSRLRTLRYKAKPGYAAQSCVCSAGRGCLLAWALRGGFGDGMAHDLPGYRRWEAGSSNCHLKPFGRCTRSRPGYYSSAALVYGLGCRLDSRTDASFRLAANVLVDTHRLYRWPIV